MEVVKEYEEHEDEQYEEYEDCKWVEEEESSDSSSDSSSDGEEEVIDEGVPSHKSCLDSGGSSSVQSKFSTPNPFSLYFPRSLSSIMGEQVTASSSSSSSKGVEAASKGKRKTSEAGKIKKSKGKKAKKMAAGLKRVYFDGKPPRYPLGFVLAASAILIKVLMTAARSKVWSFFHRFNEKKQPVSFLYISFNTFYAFI